MTELRLSRIVSRKALIERAPGRFVAPCPFHNEQTPSFIVDDAHRTDSLQKRLRALVRFNA
jgi:DNA primase